MNANSLLWRFVGESGRVFIKIAGDISRYSKWSSEIYGTNNFIPYGIEQGTPITFSLVLNLSETGDETDIKGNNYTGYRLSLYIDGKEKMFSYLNIDQWTTFKEIYLGKTDTLDLGRYRNYYPDLADNAYMYGKISLKNLRFYTRPLSAEEIELNYDTRLAYDEANN